MHILKSRPWNLPESSVTPEALVFGRRKALALGAGMLAAGPALAQQATLPPAMRPPSAASTPSSGGRIRRSPCALRTSMQACIAAVIRAASGGR